MQSWWISSLPHAERASIVQSGSTEATREAENAAKERKIGYSFSDYSEEIACDLYGGDLRLENPRIKAEVEQIISKIDSAFGGDVRFSEDLPNLAELKRENKKLKTQVDNLRKQLKPGTRLARMGDVNRLAVRLIKSNGAQLKAAVLSFSAAEWYNREKPYRGGSVHGIHQDNQRQHRQGAYLLRYVEQAERYKKGMAQAAL